MRILVTGGAGFIGSHVVDAYVAAGHEVRVLDDLSTGERQQVHPGATLVVGDIRDAAAIARALEGGVDLVNHHAAQMDVRKSVADPAFDADTNITGSLRLIEAAIAAGAKKFIFASSGGATYGEPEFAPQSETHPQRPLSPYGCSKLALEKYLDYYAVVRGLTTVLLRYANVYGPRQRAHGEAGVVAIFTGKLLRGEPVTINGSGEQTRDYVCVDDVVRANLAAATLDLRGSFNVGTGVETSVNQLFDRLNAITGGNGRATHAPAKTGEQMRSVLDATRLREAAALPATMPLEEGLQRMVAWFIQRMS
jgi:UDP-glucose 4-epimerase